ncbi:hypothetical protein G6F40_014831 [Rhizopus arrhizus]|nr:hypothetical protein G6F40_014831 [Rhizopus arrhizus]
MSLLDGQVEAVSGFGAQRRERAGDVVGDADLDGVCHGHGRHQRGDGDKGSDQTHGGVLRARARAEGVLIEGAIRMTSVPGLPAPLRRRQSIAGLITLKSTAMVTLYRHVDRADLDVHYNAHATVPDSVVTDNASRSPLSRARLMQMGLAPASSRIPGILPSLD